MKKFRDRKPVFNTDSSSDSEPEPNLFIHKRTLNENMSQPVVNVVNAPVEEPEVRPVVIDTNLVKYFAEFIPTFDGNPLELRQYIAQVESTFTEIPEAAHRLVFAHARQKLRGAAKITCGGRTEITTWQGLKNRLIALYSCTDTLETLEMKLNQSYPKSNESLLSFGNRLQLMRSQIIDKIHFSNDDPNRKILKIEFSEQNAKNRFITFVPERFQSDMRLAHPVALEQAMDIFCSLEQEYENRMAQRNLSNFHQRQLPNPKHQPQNNKNNQNNFSNPGPSGPRPGPPPQHKNQNNFSNQQNFNRHNPNQHNPNQQRNNNPNRFPQHFNNQQRQFPKPNNFNHNRNNFNPNRNFNTQQQIPMSGVQPFGTPNANNNNQNRDTPMSGVEHFNIENPNGYSTEQIQDQHLSNNFGETNPSQNFENYNDYNYFSPTENTQDSQDFHDFQDFQDFQEFPEDNPQS